MELAQIRMFKAVVELGSITKAAETLHCVPSNITARIKALEAELNVSLFYREGRGLRISPSGDIFLTYAEKILALTDDAKRALEPSAQPSGILRIGAIESSATSRLPPILTKFHRQYPAVSLQFKTATWSELVEDIHKHRLDGAVIAVDIDRPFLESTPFLNEALLLVSSTTSPPIQSAADLTGKTAFMWPDPCPYRAALQSWLSTNKVTIPIVSMASYGTIIGCISAGDGVSLVPKGVFEQYQTSAELVGYEFSDLKAINNHFIWRKDSHCYPALEAFINMLRESNER